MTRKLALAFADMDNHPLAVDIGHLQIQRFLATETRAVVQGEQRAMLGVHLRVQQCSDFFAAPDCGQLPPYLGLDDLLIKPGLLQRPRVEKLQRRSSALNRSPRQLAFVEQKQQVRTNMLWAQLIGRPVEVLGELGNGVGVVAHGAFGEVARPGESGLAVRLQLRGAEPDPAAATDGSTAEMLREQCA